MGTLKIIYRNQPLKIEYFLRRGEKETVLYIHGLGCSKDDFFGALKADGLKDHTLAAFDFPGCGYSTYPKEMALGIDDLVEITDIIVSKLSLKNLILVGHSMGGLVALLYAEKHCENVRGFINVEGNLASRDSTISRRVTKYGFDEFKDILFQIFKEKLLATRNVGFKKHVEILEKYSSESSKKAFFDYSPSLMEYSDSCNLIQRFSGIKIPTIFVYGSENSNRISYIKDLKKAGCKIAEISGSNHFPHYDNPKEFYDVISKFLDEL